MTIFLSLDTWNHGANTILYVRETLIFKQIKYNIDLGLLSTIWKQLHCKLTIFFSSKEEHEGTKISWSLRNSQHLFATEICLLQFGIRDRMSIDHKYKTRVILIILPENILTQGNYVHFTQNKSRENSFPCLKRVN